MAGTMPRRRVGADVVAALGLCCSLAASCGPPDIVLDFRGGSGGNGAAGSSSSGGSGGGTSGMMGECADDTVCMMPGEGQGPYLVWMGPKGKAPAKGPMRASWPA